MKKNLKLILDLFNKKEKKQLVFILLLLILMGFLELAGIGSLGQFISLAANPGMIHTNAYFSTAYKIFHFSNDAGFVIAFGITVVVLLALSNLYLIMVTCILHYYSAKRRHSLAVRFLEKYLRQPYVYYLNTNTSALNKKILEDVSTFIASILLVVLNFVSSVIISFFIIVFLIMIKPLLAMIISIIFGASYFGIFSSVKKLLAKKGKDREIQNGLRFKYINEIFGGIKEIKILGKERVFLKSFSDVTKKHALSNSMCDIINETPKYLLEIITMGSVIGGIVFMVSSGIKLDHFFPILTIYIFGAYRLLPCLQKIFKAIAGIKFHLPLLENLHRDYMTLPDGENLPEEICPRMPFKKSISFCGVGFSYPNTRNYIIKEQSLVIKANTSVAIVGPTGCGKTTLADIILGLLKPQTGKLLVDDIEIIENNRKNWQKNLGYVPQIIFLSDDTIRHNIAFGILPEKIDNNAVINAAKLANIHNFIVNELENGYDTVIGERGIRISGGQRQRIGIARAVYHDPSVLILDEATSALDGFTENIVIDAIQNMNHKKTIIMIAHRISTVKHCDIIHVMDKGRFTDSGTYNELYLNSSSFRKLADGK